MLTTGDKNEDKTTAHFNGHDNSYKNIKSKRGELLNSFAPCSIIFNLRFSWKMTRDSNFTLSLLLGLRKACFILVD